MTAPGEGSKESEENWGIFAGIAIALYSTKWKANIGMTTFWLCTASVVGLAAKKGKKGRRKEWYWLK